MDFRCLLRCGRIPDWVEVGSYGVAGEQFLPDSRHQFDDAFRSVPVDSLKDIDEVSVGIHTVHSAGRQQILDGAGVLDAEFGPGEQLVEAANRDGA